MPYIITKEFEFEAAHQLRHLPAEHQCARLHGHSYRFQVELHAGQLDDRGFVYDYGDVSSLAAPLLEKFDHQNLNHVFDGNPMMTTAEHLAQRIWHHFDSLVTDARVRVAAVRVSETRRTWAEYRP